MIVDVKIKTYYLRFSISVFLSVWVGKGFFFVENYYESIVSYL
jgi:hypothetical protein